MWKWNIRVSWNSLFYEIFTRSESAMYLFTKAFHDRRWSLLWTVHKRTVQVSLILLEGFEFIIYSCFLNFFVNCCFWCFPESASIWCSKKAGQLCVNLRDIVNVLTTGIGGRTIKDVTDNLAKGLAKMVMLSASILKIPGKRH